MWGCRARLLWVLPMLQVSRMQEAHNVLRRQG
jgi:hypothetical protein